ncbi:hypothetical protein GGF50DRAFT_113685 [Schizophyllum commune]
MPVDKTRKPPRQSANDVKIPRPPNAWILFRSHQSKERKKNQDNNNMHQQPAQSVISAEISRMWKELSVEDRRYWERMAEREADRHKKLHPNYKYQPQKKEDKEREREQKKLEKEQARRERDAAARAAKGKGRRTLAAPRCVPSNAPVASLPVAVPYYVPGYMPGSTDAEFAGYGNLGPSPPVSAASSPEPDHDWPDASASPASSGPALTPLPTPYHTPQVESDASSSTSISPITYQPPHGHPLPPTIPIPAFKPVYVPPQPIHPQPIQTQRIPSGASSAPPPTPMTTGSTFEQVQQESRPQSTFDHQQPEDPIQQLHRLQQAIQEQQQREQQASTPAVTPAPTDWQPQQQLPPASHMPPSQSDWHQQQPQDMSNAWQQPPPPPQWQDSPATEPPPSESSDSQTEIWPSQSSETTQVQDFLTFDMPASGGGWPVNDDGSQAFSQTFTLGDDGQGGMLGGLRLEGTDHPEMFMVQPENWDLNPDSFDLANSTIPILNGSMLDFSFGLPENLPDAASPSTSYAATPATEMYATPGANAVAGPSRPMSAMPYEEQPSGSAGSDPLYMDYRYGDEFINYDGGAGPSSRPAPAHSQSTPVVPQASEASPAPTYTPPSGAQFAGVRRVGGAWRRPRPAVEQEATPSCGVPAN